MVKLLRRVLPGLLALAVGWGLIGGAALAQQRILRVDEVAIGQLDPAKATDYADSMLMFNIYDALVFPEAGGGVTPHLAERWSITPDGLVYTFTLRPARFHDGRTVTAEDVVFSLERMIAIGEGFSFLFTDWIQSARAVNPRTVEFRLVRPYAPFLAALVRLPVVNRAVVMANLQPGPHGQFQDYGQAYLATNDAGSGAYRVVSHDPSELTVMERFDGYFLPFAARAPDVVRIRYSLEPATVRTLMARDEHQITSQWLPPEIIAALGRTGGIKLLEEPGQSIFFLMLNTQRPPTDDVHFRRAMALALDYESLLGILRITDQVAGGTRARGPLPAGFPGYDESIPFARRDLAAARAELAQSRYRPGDHVVEIGWVAEVPVEERFSLLLQQSLAEIGIRANVVRVPWALMTERATRPETTPHVANIYVSATFPDPDAMLYNMYHSAAAGTWLSMSWLNSPAVDRLLDQARTTIAPERREELYRELQRRIIELQPDIFGYEQVAVFAAQEYITVPTLESPDPPVAVTGANWIFRLIEMNR